MFKNNITHKMPCWSCNKIGNCRIQDAIMNLPYPITSQMTDLTFNCESKEGLNECNNCN